MGCMTHLVHTRNDSFSKTCQKKNVCFQESWQEILLLGFVRKWLCELTHYTSGSQGVNSCGNPYPQKCLGKDLLKNMQSLCLRYSNQMEEKGLSGTAVATQALLGQLHSHRDHVLYFPILTITLHMALAELQSKVCHHCQGEKVRMKYFCSLCLSAATALQLP